MDMILDRQQFTDLWPVKNHDALWAYERYVKKSCWYFVCVKSDRFRNTESADYWTWCDQNCQGFVCCYSSSEQGEWWGFSEYEDIAWWMLKWA
jgi:hypothetical protein